MAITFLRSKRFSRICSVIQSFLFLSPLQLVARKQFFFVWSEEKAWVVKCSSHLNDDFEWNSEKRRIVEAWIMNYFSGPAKMMYLIKRKVGTAREKTSAHWFSNHMSDVIDMQARGKTKRRFGSPQIYCHPFSAAQGRRAYLGGEWLSFGTRNHFQNIKDRSTGPILRICSR
ncbi:MAG: hypothetical protein CM1200mP24_05070 [Gammaproteobacteria bacterium]|nr:MAG: hypothetical protein CM1200mP24_05070 [Gammaproteobacteria bacterium]